MSVSTLLNCLNHVKPKAKNRWIARCPAHEDQWPSLSIRETDDGTVLIKCFAGCGAVDVIAAVGLEFKDLFPERPRESHSRPRGRPDHWHAMREALNALHFEVLLVAGAADNIVNGKPISAIDVNRMRLAANSIRSTVESLSLIRNRGAPAKRSGSKSTT